MPHLTGRSVRATGKADDLEPARGIFIAALVGAWLWFSSMLVAKWMLFQ